MTYYSSRYNYYNYQQKSYEWTAYKEADFLGAHTGSSIGCGDKFTMPGGGPTVCMSTYDNDGYLSGDSNCDENADDRDGQNAYIDGGRVGGQLYAECYHVLKGSDGKTYYLIEIEVEGYDAPGAGDDFFTFYGAVPPAGVELCVVQTCNVSGCMIDYRCLGAGEKAPANTPPEFTNEPSYGKICIDENTTFVIDLNANDKDGDTLTYEIIGGADADKFVIDAQTGELKFKEAPDYENPTDYGQDNKYEVKVKVSDGKGGEDTTCLTVCVDDVDEGQPKCIVIEAESMCAWGMSKAWGCNASGGKLMKLDCAGGDGVLWTKFSGETGTYDLKLFVQDENDGQSVIKIKVNHEVVKTIVLNKDTDGSGSDNGKFSEIVLNDIKLNPCDTISIWVDGNCGEYVRIDKIELCKDDEPLGSIGDKVWFDADRDGIQDATEAGVADVTVNLLDASDNVIATQQTDGNGNYLFQNLAAGDYRVQFVAPAGATEFTTQDAGADDAADSDANASGVTGVITLAAGENNLTVDAGIRDQLGSLSGRYFIDANEDDLDNDGANGVAGITVELLDASGVPTGITTTTDATGGYAFAGLVAGTYGVKFTDTVTGLTLVTPNVGANDTIDSDATDLGGGMSQITGIVVLAGQDTPDNDAGVFDPNDDPTPADDIGKTCADEELTVDVLANDTDPNGDALTITHVNGMAISEGQTVSTSAGTLVKLLGGMLVIDGETAYEDLDIGEHASEDIIYTVSDGMGGSADATLSMEFCGDANSVESFCASLPTDVTYQVLTSNLAFPIEEYAMDVKIVVSGDDRFDGDIFVEAYCLAYGVPAATAETYAAAPINGGNMFCATDPAAAGVAQNLDVVNWILNQHFEDEFQFNGWEVQRAIWEIVDGVDTSHLDAISTGFGQDADVDYIVAQAWANGVGYTPGVGDVIGVIIDPDGSNPRNVQPFILAMDFEQYDCLC